VKIKICGLTRLEDAQKACELGAWAVGFIFVPESPRYISPQAVREIVSRLPVTVEKIGVFQDATIETVKKVRESLGLTVVQLHGSESPGDAKAIGGRVIKAVRAKSFSQIQELSDYEVEAFLVDGAGKGALANWEWAKAAKQFGPVILAGGLNRQNLTSAVTSVNPYAVDISSSIESEPGVKDHAKLKELFK